MNMPSSATFAKLKDACTATGLSMYFLRQGCKDGTIPHIRSGATYYVNVPALLEKLDEQSRETKGTAS